MPGDLERLPAYVAVAAPGAGQRRWRPSCSAGCGPSCPRSASSGEREQVLVAAWLTGLRSARTRRAYAGDLAAWLGWLADRDTDVLAAGRVHVDLWAATQLDAGAAASSVRRRLSALSSFYRYCVAHDLIGRVPTAGRGPAGGGSGLHRHGRPGPGPGPGPGRRRRRRHRRPGAAHRGGGAAAAAQRAARRRGLRRRHRRPRRGLRPPGAARGPQGRPEGEGPAHPGHRWRPWRPTWPTGPSGPERPAGGSWPGRCWPPPPAGGSARATCGSWCAAWPAPPGSARGSSSRRTRLRHSAITFALDAGAALRDVQDYAGHNDPRTTRRYDHSRDSLDRNAAYTVAAYLA